MVGKSKIIILSIFIFSLAFFLSSIVFPKRSLACHLGGPYTYYQTCSQGSYCSYNSGCGSGSVSAYDFAPDLGGCVMGYAAGQYYSASCVVSSTIPTCTCYGPEAKWYTVPSSNGQICKRRSGIFCIDGVKEGKWDSSQSKCVVCDSYGRETGYFDCNGEYSGNYLCESACGADDLCDEKFWCYVSGNLWCNDYCKASVCNSNNECKWFEVPSNCPSAGYIYQCYYSWRSGSGVWKWGSVAANDEPGESDEDGNPWQECFDGFDNDCDGYKDCADPGCKGVQNPNTGDICCQSDSDCPAYDPNTHLKMYCDPNTHTCKTKPSCALPEDCEDKWCCDTITGTKACKAQGTIISSGGKSYICDPPEGFINFSDENTNIQVNKKLTLLDLLINPFYYFLER